MPLRCYVMEGATTTLAVGLVCMINDPTLLAFYAAESRPEKIDAATKASTEPRIICRIWRSHLDVSSLTFASTQNSTLLGYLSIVATLAQASSQFQCDVLSVKSTRSDMNELINMCNTMHQAWEIEPICRGRCARSHT